MMMNEQEFVSLIENMGYEVQKENGVVLVLEDKDKYREGIQWLRDLAEQNGYMGNVGIKLRHPEVPVKRLGQQVHGIPTFMCKDTWFDNVGYSITV